MKIKHTHELSSEEISAIRSRAISGMSVSMYQLDILCNMALDLLRLRLDIQAHLDAMEKE